MRCRSLGLWCHLIGLSANHEMATLFPLWRLVVAGASCLSWLLTTWQKISAAPLISCSCNWLWWNLSSLLWQMAYSSILAPNELYRFWSFRQTISMTGEIGNQVAFLLMTLSLLQDSECDFYNPKNMKRGLIFRNSQQNVLGVFVSCETKILTLFSENVCVKEDDIRIWVI